MLGPFEEDVTNWNIVINFSDSLDWLDSVMADVSGSGVSWSLASKDWDGQISAGDTLGVRFIVGYSGNKVSPRVTEAHSPCRASALGKLRQLRHGGL